MRMLTNERAARKRRGLNVRRRRAAAEQLCEVLERFLPSVAQLRRRRVEAAAAALAQKMKSSSSPGCEMKTCVLAVPARAAAEPE